MAYDLAARPDALARALALNAAVEEMTSPLTPARLADLVGWSAGARGIDGADGRLAGFLLGFAPGSGYDSPNYRWFCDRLDRFAYIDRVVVDAAARGQGIGRRLYADFAALAAARGLGPLVCEVNSHPPNPGSDAFHAALGFAEMGRGSPASGKVVRYLICREPAGRND